MKNTLLNLAERTYNAIDTFMSQGVQQDPLVDNVNSSFCVARYSKDNLEVVSKREVCKMLANSRSYGACRVLPKVNSFSVLSFENGTTIWCIPDRFSMSTLKAKHRVQLGLMG